MSTIMPVPVDLTGDRPIPYTLTGLGASTPVPRTALVPVVPSPEEADANGIRHDATPALAAAAVLHPDARVITDLDDAIMFAAPLPPGEHMWIAYPQGGRAMVIVDFAQYPAADQTAPEARS